MYDCSSVYVTRSTLIVRTNKSFSPALYAHSGRRKYPTFDTHHVRVRDSMDAKTTTGKKRTQYENNGTWQTTTNKLSFNLFFYILWNVSCFD